MRLIQPHAWHNQRAGGSFVWISCPLLTYVVAIGVLVIDGRQWLAAPVLHYLRYSSSKMLEPTSFSKHGSPWYYIPMLHRRKPRTFLLFIGCTCSAVYGRGGVIGGSVIAGLYKNNKNKNTWVGLSCPFIATHISGDHSTQDPSRRQKPLLSRFFTKHIGPWLLRSPVIVRCMRWSPPHEKYQPVHS